MRLLLDTHVLLWTLADDPRLRRNARAAIESASEIHFSVASCWEIAIKAGIGRLDADVAEIRRVANHCGFIELPVLGEHVEALQALRPLHRDPFDRLLVAQALTEPLRLLTHDPQVARYGDTIVEV